MEISDEERKRLEERRATQEKVSSMMGDYLLKGYRMLDSYCPTCGVSNMAGLGYEISKIFSIIIFTVFQH